MSKKAQPEPVYDDYFYYARPENQRYWWIFSNVKNVTKEDVTCKHCNYVTRPKSVNPKAAFAQHMRKHHRPFWDMMHGHHYTIHEEPEPDRTISNVS